MIRRMMEWLFSRPGYDPDDMQAAAAEDMTAREIARLTAANMALVDQLAEACRDRDDAMAFASISGEILTRRTEALRRIAARVTASPNAASRDMARIAREALE